MAEPSGALPEPVSVVSGDGRRYRCRACKAPIRRGDRCAACSRGWFVELVDATSDGAVTDHELIRKVLYDAISPNWELNSGAYRRAADAVLAVLAGRLLPEPLKARTEWGVQWHGMDVVTEQGGVPYDERSARAVAARCLHAVAVCRRKADPWVAVDPDTKEDTP